MIGHGLCLENEENCGARGDRQLLLSLQPLLLRLRKEECWSEVRMTYQVVADDYTLRMIHVASETVTKGFENSLVCTQ